MIGIVGGGNIGTELAGELAYRGFEVCLFAKDISNFNGKIKVDDVDKNTSYTIRPKCITNSLTKLCELCDTIIVTYPSNAFKYIKDELVESLKNKRGTRVVFMPGLGGVEFVFRDLVLNGSTIIGLQRVPAVYRLVVPGREVMISGRRKEGLFAAAIPAMKKGEAKQIIEDLFQLKCEEIPNYLSVTLTPSNPILHTSRLYSLFNKYEPEHVFTKNPLFYGEWNEDSSKLLIECDNELKDIKAKLKDIDLTFVESLLDHYESTDSKSLTEKISSISSLHNLKSPMIEVGENQYKVDWSSRYFKADFPNGIVILKAIAMLADIDTPAMDKIIFWYQKQIGKQYLLDKDTLGKDIIECNVPQNYGITTAEELEKYYK